MSSVAVCRDMDRLVLVRLCLEAMIVLSLVACFTLQVLDGLDKFFKKQTSMMVETNNTKAINFPQITMCRGIKKSKKRENLMETFFDHNPGRQKASEEEIQAWWRDQNYRLRDFLYLVRFEEPSGGTLVLDLENLDNGHDSYQVTRLSSVSGDCFKFDFPNPVDANSHIQFQFNLTAEERVRLYLHAKGEEFGIYWNYWLNPISFFKVEPGLKADVLLSYSTTQYLNTADNPCEDKVEYKDCVNHWLKKNLKDAQCTQAKTACRLPMAASLMGQMDDIPLCLTRNESDCMSNHVMQKIRNSSIDKPQSNGCQKSCIKKTILAQVLEDPSNTIANTRADIFMLFSESAYPMYTEYRIFDLNGIVAMVGGSLGLFLGFSGRGFLLSILDFLWQRCLLQTKTPVEFLK
ncbi:uncharacterized protein LOC131885281 [Tigriopus californicus]|uniref:uncharacterized protein LOC131885281 n=1 Tax=Tigriopus californicus TaxID=6832 RepID=UPI0027DA0B67|nr:uncharacterized protein LOC131885281 [Tigriopus californicus]